MKHKQSQYDATQQVKNRKKSAKTKLLVSMLPHMYSKILTLSKEKPKKKKAFLGPESTTSTGFDLGPQKLPLLSPNT